MMKHQKKKRLSREIAADLKFLESTVKGAQPGPSEAEIEKILLIQRRVRQEFKKANRAPFGNKRIIVRRFI